MQPFDYTLDVQSPSDALFTGLALGDERRQAAQNLAIGEQNMGLAASQEERAAAAFAAAQEDRQRQLAQEAEDDAAAEAMNADLLGLSEKVAGGQYNADDFAAMALKYPTFAEEIGRTWEGRTKARKDEDTSALMRGITALKLGRPDIAVTMLEDRATAAENAGDQMEADISRAMIAGIKADPSSAIAVLGTTLSALDPDAAKTVFGDTLSANDRYKVVDGALVDLAGPGGPKAVDLGLKTGPEWRAATPDEASARGAKAGQINDKTGEFEAARVPEGMTLTSDGNGGFTLTQGEIDPAKAATAQDVKGINTDIILNAARKARELIGWGSTGLVGQAAANVPASNASEIVRQVNVLKAQASAENIAAMRRASPTGAALGGVSDKDLALLADKSGAVDPFAGAKRFSEQLDDYERTLLRIVHGVEEGDRIFSGTRAAPAGSNSPPPGDAAPPASFDPAEIDDLLRGP